MSLPVIVNEDSRRAVDLLIKFQQQSRASVADATEIKRPNFAGWLNRRNGISEKRLDAVMRTLHIPRGDLDGGWVHRWAVSGWEDVRELLELLLVPEEKQRIEIFHVGRDEEKPAAILRCNTEVDDGGTHSPVEVFFMIILTPAPLAPPLQLLSDIHLGFGTVRKKEPPLTPEELPTIEYLPLANALAEAYDLDYLTEDMKGIFEDPRAKLIDEVLDAEIHSTLKRAGRENTRFMLGLAARQPDTVRALQAARKFGYSDDEVCGWIELLTREPEFSKVLVAGLLKDAKK